MSSPIYQFEEELNNIDFSYEERNNITTTPNLGLLRKRKNKQTEKLLIMSHAFHKTIVHLQLLTIICELLPRGQSIVCIY